MFIGNSGQVLPTRNLDFFRRKSKKPSYSTSIESNGYRTQLNIMSPCHSIHLTCRHWTRCILLEKPSRRTCFPFLKGSSSAFFTPKCHLPAHFLLKSCNDVFSWNYIFTNLGIQFVKNSIQVHYIQLCIAKIFFFTSQQEESELERRRKRVTVTVVYYVCSKALTCSSFWNFFCSVGYFKALRGVLRSVSRRFSIS